MMNRGNLINVNIKTDSAKVFLTCVVLFAALACVSLAAWIQHLYTCFVEEAWMLLIAGAIFPPVGVVHGIGIWTGLW